MPMKYKASNGSGDFKALPPGAHLAICNLIADLGMQPGSAMFPAPKRQVYIRFEVPEERVENGPMVIGQFFTASMNEKANLRKQLESWRGRAFTDDEAENFDVAKILGQPCMLSVVENKKDGKVYSNIAAISGVPKGTTLPKPENDLLCYSEDDQSAFAKLPEWLQKKIQGQIREQAHPDYDKPLDGQYFAQEPNQHGVYITDEDIPF